MTANDTQIGGDHYKTGGEEHWDRAMRLDFNPMQYIITKWAERAGKKGGLDGAIKDVKKIRHAADKWLEVLQKEANNVQTQKAGAERTRIDKIANPGRCCLDCGAVLGAEAHAPNCNFENRNMNT